MIPRYRYKWLDLETGERGIKYVEAFSRGEFLELLNKWNTLAFGMMQYGESYEELE